MESERKTLQEQIQESKELKQLEYQKQLESQNSSYKLDEKSAEFYERLNKIERAREEEVKQSEMEELEKFRKLKEDIDTNKSESSVPILSPPKFKVPFKQVIIKKRKLSSSVPSSRKSRIIKTKMTTELDGIEKVDSREVTEGNSESNVLNLSGYTSSSEED